MKIGKGRYFRAITNKLKLKEKMILIYTVIVALPMIFVGFFSYNRYKDVILQEVNLSFNQTIKQVNENINYKLTFYKDFADYIIYSESVKSILTTINNTFEQEDSQFTNLRTLKNLINSKILDLKEISDLRIYKRNISLPTDGYYIFDESDIKDEIWYKNMVNNQIKCLWLKEYDSFANSYSISYVVPVFYFSDDIVHFDYENSRIGTLKIDFSSKQIINILKKFDIDGGRILITDENGDILFSAKDEKLQNIGSEELSKIKGNISGTFETTISNQNYFAIFDDIGINNWKTIIYIPVKNVNTRISSVARGTMLTTLILFLAAIIAIIIVSRILLRRIYQLENKILRIKNGDIDNVDEIRGNDEIAELDRGFNEMLGRLKQLLKDVYYEKVQKKEAELKSLQAQINPHFLYNTLESIKCSIDMDEKENAIKMVIALKNLFRIGINSGKEFITLEDEIKHAMSYIEIQKFRYGDRFEVTWNVDQSLLNTRVLKTILQPVIENAIYHAFDKLRRRGLIEITIGRKDKNVEIMIKDNGVGINEQKLLELREMLLGNREAGSIGLKNVNERIKLYYGDGFGIKLFSNPEEGTRVIINYPADTTV